MRGDFTRDIFDPSKHYSRVLAQQGRVLLDDGLNAQTAIHLHYLRGLARDLIGPHGGPRDRLGFTLTSLPTGQGPFRIGTGRYYVDGILCENEADVGYFEQPAWYRQPRPQPGAYLVYLDVWERHVTADQDPLLREAALGGPDTTTRAEIVWQVKTHALQGTNANRLTDQQLKAIFDGLRGVTPRLKARAKEDQLDEQPCALDPTSRYRGMENQLYRVEIHRGGEGVATSQALRQPQTSRGRQRAAAEQQQQAAVVGASFKWSRDNGAVAVFPVMNGTGQGLVLEHLGRDEAAGLAEQDWVELIDDDQEYGGGDGRRLLQVDTVDPNSNLVKLHGSFGVNVDDLQNPLLRRWEQSGRNAPLVEGAMPVRTGTWIDLEDGVQVWFDQDGDYRPGTFWLIPARVATGNVEWPQLPQHQGGGPALREPNGIVHHYAPLYQVTVAGNGITIDHHLRREFRDLCEITAKDFP
jgi:hypothetical protein